MYKIINNDTGVELGVTEELRYICKNPDSGSYIRCDGRQAEGISFNGRWNIYPCNDMEDADGQVVIQKVDVTSYINEIKKLRRDLEYLAKKCGIELESNR